VSGDGHARPLKHQYELPIVGRPPAGEIHYLNADAVLDIHHQLVEDFAADDDPIEPPAPGTTPTMTQMAPRTMAAPP
jgi:hypothetical protein